MLEIRRVRSPAELAAAGAVTVAAYVANGYTDPVEPYADFLRDAAARDVESEVWVAVDEGAVLGTVTYCPGNARERQVGRSGEAEFRALAVDPAARGCGVGEALARHVLHRARSDGCTGVALLTLPEMHGAHRLYRRLGFVRDPGRDHTPRPELTLWAFALGLRAG